MTTSAQLFLILLVFARMSPALQTSASANGQTKPDSARQTQTADASGNDFTVFYTGKLFGYLRVDGCGGLSQSETPQRLIKPDNCASDYKGPQDTKQQVNCFINKLNSERPSDSKALLVGMGDNFAPRLEARMEQSFSQDDKWWKPRKKTPDLDDVKSDPVGCFLRAAHYDAVVPGMEDFDLGPERIRNIANFLRTSSPAVPMLGANIVYNIHYKKPGDPIPDEQKKLEFDTFRNQQRFQPQSSEPFLPSLRYIEFRVPLLVNECKGKEGCDTITPRPSQEVKALLDKARAKPIDIEDPKSPDPASIFKSLQEGHSSILCGPYGDLDVLTAKSGKDAANTANSNCALAQKIEIFQNGPKDDGPKDSSPKGWQEFTREIAEALDVCIGVLRKEPEETDLASLLGIRNFVKSRRQQCGDALPYLKGDSVDLASPLSPSVQLRWSIDNTLLPTDGNPSSYKGSPRDFTGDKSYRFCIATKASAKELLCQRLPIRHPVFQDMYVYSEHPPAVIFGVVDPDLRSQMPDPAGSWKEDPEHGRKVEIETVDPQAALVQAEDAFMSAHPEFHGKFPGKKILLAQMDVHRAEELTAHLDPLYAVDVTVARADQVHSTPEMKLTLKKTEQQKLPVLVPSPIFLLDTKDLINPLAKAIYTQRGTEVRLSTKNYANERLKVVPEEAQGEFVGLVCIDPSTEVFIAGLYDDPNNEAPRMLARLRCAAKEYLDKLAQREAVFSKAATLDPLKGSNSSDFVDAILQIMRKRAHTDLAMLEQRELYGIVESNNSDKKASDAIDNPDQNDPAYLRKFLDRVLWESSTVQKLSVTGATLKSVLKQSEDYKSQEESTTQHVEIFGRSVNIAGLQKGASKDEYIINGKLLDDATEYSIATSERMLTGNSDYPDLRKDLAGKPVEIDSSNAAAYISFLACDELRKSTYLQQLGEPTPQCLPDPGETCKHAPKSRACQEEQQQLAHDYKQPASIIFAKRPECGSTPDPDGLLGSWCAKPKEDFRHSMLDPSGGIGYARRVMSSFWIPRQSEDILSITKPRSFVEGAELADQFQHTRRFSISELSVGFSGSVPDENAQQLSTLFSSATLSTAGQPRTQSVDVKNTARYYVAHFILHSHGLDWYASDTLAFSTVDQGQTGPFPNKITFNSNQWTVVPVAFSWSFSSNLKNFFDRKPDRLSPEVNLVFEPSRFTGQFIPTDNFLTVQQAQGSGGSCSGTVQNGICSFSVDIEQQRTLSYSPRAGIRFENNDSYLELGGQGSRDWRIPVQYTFNRNSPSPIPCSADALQPCVLQNANTINVAQGIQQVNAARWQSAAYIDSVYKLPLHKSRKMYFVFKNKGEYFFNSHDDSQVLTKYDYTMSNGISVPIYGNLSLEPTVDLFWYENKVALNGLFKVNYALKLNYTVDWGIRRMRFKEATKSTPFAANSSK